MIRFLKMAGCLVAMTFASQITLAGSEVSFPEDWRSWESITTPLTTIGALPGCEADVSSLPPIYQETVEIYCAVRPEGPGAVEVLVKPDVSTSYRSRTGAMVDGPNMILHLKEMGVLFVTGHKQGAAIYGVFKEDGTDVTAGDQDSPLGVNTCRVCHSGYEAFCVAGQCGIAK